MYLLTGCLCGEDPAARSRPPCRAEGFQAESRVRRSGRDVRARPGGVWVRASAQPPFHAKKCSVPGHTVSPGAGDPPVSDNAVPPECSRKRDTSRFAGGRLPDGSRQAEGVKAQMPLGTGNLPIPDSPRPAGELPAAARGPVLPRAKPPNGGWQRAVSKRKRHQVPGSRSLTTTPPHRETPGSGTRPGFAKGKIAKRRLAKSGAKAQAPPGTGNPLAPGSGTRPGFAKGKIAKRRLAKSGVKVQAPSGTGEPLAPELTASPGRSQQRDTARFCQGQNRQTVFGEGLCQSSNAESV